MKKHITIFTHRDMTNRSHGEISRHIVSEGIDTKQYEIEVIEVDNEGVWYKNNVHIEPEQALLFTDYAWIAGYGEYMEDGQIQKMLADHRVPHNGSDAVVSKICFSKSAAKDLLQHKGIRTPAWQKHTINPDGIADLADELFQNFPQPCVVKPNLRQEEVGVYYCDTKQAIKGALRDIAAHTDTVIVEEYIKGTVVTTATVREMRDHDVYALPPVAVVSSGEIPIDTVDFVCPAGLPAKETKQVETLAAKTHAELELGSYARTEMVVHPSRGVFVLDVNPLPGFGSESAMRTAMDGVGITPKELITTCIEQAS